MRITKFGHCCLLIETKAVRILFDAGNYHEYSDVENISALLITHEHQDHMDVACISRLLELNPSMRIISHDRVAEILKAENISVEIIADGEMCMVGDVSVQSIGSEHACIHHDLPPVKNTGFLVDGKLFYPGDSFTPPNTPVDIIALPMSGPWMKVSEAIDFARAVKPRLVFPVHDGMIKGEPRFGAGKRMSEMLLVQSGIEFVDMCDGDTKEF